jgi:hypothetical protein
MEESVVLIRTVKVRETGEIAKPLPEQFRELDVDRISTVTNRIVQNLQKNLDIAEEVTGAQRLSLSEIQLEFGIDFGVNAEGEAKVPIVGPRVRGGVHGGATFTVQITLRRPAG